MLPLRLNTVWIRHRASSFIPCTKSRLYSTGHSSFPIEASHYLIQTATSDRYTLLQNRGFLEIEGADVVKFLQGLITNHMPKIERGGDGFYCAFLTPQGRVLYDAFIHPKNLGPDFPHPSFIIDVDACAVQGLSQHLNKYKLRSKVKITDATSRYRAYQAWGPSVKALWTGGPSSSDAHTVGKVIPVGAMVSRPRFCDIGGIDSRQADLGLRIVVPVNSKVPVLTNQVPEEEYTLRRIMYGVPEGMDDYFHGSSLPLESNLDYMQGVDFRKGCYLGQELTIRTYHTGVTRKRILPIQVFSDVSKPPSTLTLDTTTQLTIPASQSEINANNKSVGKFCSGRYNVGLALLRLEHVGHVVALEGGLFGKAFIPSWWPIPPPSPSAEGKQH
ncbi:aminomethyltransferase [Synchytrium microbalum]|uniref:Aminomethyltransferase n=1 Tax=Synchytrium microbalum TaxID=1806994 RepID=A0A507C4V0_9FUNG|nr:aminomethyltransferase [Synchytrium microbalum]TPX32455.1 aminomethyltransferase [Synchytrium microbalum]